MLWFIGLQVTIRELWRIEIYMKETQVKNKLPKSCIFKDWHLANGSLGLRTQQYIAFSKRIKWDLSDALKYFAQTETDFLLASAENAKKKYFWHFSDHNLWECRWYIDKWPHLSNPLSELYPLIFPFQELKKFNTIWSVPLCIMFWSVKYAFTCKRWHFLSCQHRYLFSTENQLTFGMGQYKNDLNAKIPNFRPSFPLCHR